MCLRAADVALVASGTVTVQAALHQCPMVVVYRLSPLTYRLGKPFVHVDTYAMANLIAGRRVVPELIQDAFTPQRGRRRSAARAHRSGPRDGSAHGSRRGQGAASEDRVRAGVRADAVLEVARHGRAKRLR